MDDQAPPLSLLKGAALFLDFDGTLVELASAPDAISISPSVAPLLKRLDERLEGRLALISGRSIADVEKHLDCAGLAVSGSHGFELRLRDGSHAPLGRSVDLSAARETLNAFAASVSGVLVEEKPFGIALHYRQAPEAQEHARNVAAKLAEEVGFVLQEGKMVFELRPTGADKGDALRTFMAEPDFAGARPIFVGDDMTDEDAFAAAAELGGGGVLVGPPRATAAKWRLESVSAVIDWLGRASHG
jgi:trehalose 6-phosphate phosphatase